MSVLHEVVVAVLTAAPPTAGALAAWLRSRKAEENTRPNGQGSLTEMTERLLADMGELKGMTGYTQRALEEHQRTPGAHRWVQVVGRDG